MVTCMENSIEEEEHAFVQLQEELKNVGSSIDTLNTNLEQLNQRKANCLNKMQHLQERISREGTTDVVQRLLSLSQSLKALEMQESEHKSNCNAKYSKLQAEVNELENIISCGNDDTNLSHGINHSLYNSLERLNSAKRELAVKLREIVLLKRQLDDVPSQEELIQYEHRFSELYVHIQEKLRQTRELYATFNAMLEIKDLMLKETSLLNSISSQFQDAITSTAGRTKLIDSMEGISKGTQQKLEKVQLALEAERNARDAVKQRYAAAIVEQRSCYSLLKAFQEECTKNERLRCLSSEILP
ncbi:Coiled-coil domain-containing protein 93 [Camellia lanceoleosa]|uniref:Coiled-coil domain-containing protein 93 n=1 Tax=Camellia lanceoleosa TaxID=1840588 RepID=A0ACC0FEI0_9ERIC|nr:Coiled-coil domain-containing protein 93 [Camellia lanceoleosa]